MISSQIAAAKRDAITERRRAKEKEEFDEYCETLIYPLCDSIKVTDIYILSIAVKCRNYGEKNWDSCVEYCIAYKKLDAI